MVTLLPKMKESPVTGEVMVASGVEFTIRMEESMQPLRTRLRGRLKMRARSMEGLASRSGWRQGLVFGV
tara:strand:- start:332 stop:538 length:207 start_codon:yes stop_codon:yes gene_type:complete